MPVQYESGVDELRFEGTLSGERIAGTARIENGATVRFTASARRRWRARRRASGASPTPLLNGRDLAGWTPRSAEHAGCWRVQGGVLAATPPCVDLVTRREVRGFRLHAEFRFPQGSNSGVYLRGRYEVQIQDDAGKALDALRIGGVYGFVTPATDAARARRRVANARRRARRPPRHGGVERQTIIDDQEIPGITGGALDSDEDVPGPIMLQGDHGAIEFRNLTIAPAR